MKIKPKILHLTLKKKWFDMIDSGEKKEEYREIKHYWFNRLVTNSDWGTESDFHIIYPVGLVKAKTFESFDLIEFKNGYAKDAPTIRIEFNGIDISTAKGEWSDNWQGKVFVIKLGNKLP